MQGNPKAHFARIAGCRVLQVMFDTVPYELLKSSDTYNAFGTRNTSGKGTGQIAKFLKGCLEFEGPGLDQVKGAAAPPLTAPLFSPSPSCRCRAGCD